MIIQCKETDWSMELRSCENVCQNPAVTFIHWEARDGVWAQCKAHDGLELDAPYRQVSKEEFIVLEVMLS
jgi:hypothetical protein